MDLTSGIPDPRIQALIRPSMVAPVASSPLTAMIASGPPLPSQSAAPSGSPLTSRIASPSQGGPFIPNALPLGLQTALDQNKLDYYKNSGSGIDQISHPVNAQGTPTGQPVSGWAKLGTGIARTADILGSVFAPNIAQAIPGTTLHHNMLVNQQEAKLANDQQQQQAQAQTDNLAATTAHTQAATNDLLNPADHYKPLQTGAGIDAFDPKTGKAIPVLGTDGTQLGAPDKTPKPKSIEEQAYDYARSQGKSPVEALGIVAGAKDVKPEDLPHMLYDAETSGNAGQAAAVRRVIQETQVQPKIDVHTANTPAVPSFGGGSSVTGDDYLKTLPASIQNTVKATAAGDIAIPPAGTRNPQAQALRQAVMNYDPTFTDSRYKGKQMFKTGGDAQTITQLATATEHLDNLRSNNAAVGFAPFIGESLTPESTRYNQDVKLFSQEAGKLIKSGVLTEGEYNDLKGGLMSSRQDLRSSAIDELTNLMSGKVSGVFQKYKNATGEDLPADKFFDAPTQQRLQRFGITAPGGTIGGGTSAAGGDSIPAAAASQLQEGVVHTFGNGQQWTKRNGASVRVN